MRKKKDLKKLGINRETLAVLTPLQSAAAVGGAAIRTGGGDIQIGIDKCQASVLVCSVMETCVSCKAEASPAFVAY